MAWGWGTRQNAGGSPQSDYMRVVEELEDLDLAPHLLVHVQLPDTVAVQNLDCNFVASQLVLCDCTPRHTLRRQMGGTCLYASKLR